MEPGNGNFWSMRSPESGIPIRVRDERWNEAYWLRIVSRWVTWAYWFTAPRSLRNDARTCGLRSKADTTS